MQSGSETYIIIQARMTSTRLANKVLLPLCGKTVLEVIVDRLIGYKDNIIIATTNDGTEAPIIAICQKHNIKFYQGSVNDVLERYYLSARKFGAKDEDIIVRITSDCPLIDAELMCKCINMYKSGKYDYVSNRLNRTIPVGLDVEVLSFKLLKHMHEHAKAGFEREHVTPYVYITKKASYNLGSCEEKIDSSSYRLTVDEYNDYKAIKEIYRKFNNETSFDYSSLIKMLSNHPYIKEINNLVKQKEILVEV